MTDYDLGKAHGRIIIDHDKRGFRRAEGAADDLSKSAERMAEGFEDAGKAQKEFEKQTARSTRTQEALNTKTRDAEKALNRLNEANEKANRLKVEGKKDTDEYRVAQENLNKAKNRYQEAIDDAADAETRHRNEIHKTELAMGKLEEATRDANKELGELNDNLSQPKKLKIDTSEADQNIRRTRREMHFLNEMMLKSPGAAGSGAKISTGVLGGTAAGGLLGLAASGGTGAAALGLGGIVEGIVQMSGALGTLPGIIGSVVTAVATVKIGFSNFGNALSSIGTDKFAEALKKLAPEAQKAAIAVSSLKGAFDNLKLNVQNQLMDNWGQLIKDVGGAYIPILNTGFTDLAAVMNKATHEFGQFLMQPEIQSDIKTFLGYVRDGFGEILGAMKPLLSIFNSIMMVSGEFLPELGKGIGDMLRQFANFLKQAREDGSFHDFIQSGLDAMKTFGRAVRDLSMALHNIFTIGEDVGGGFLNWLAKIGKEFRAWTESTEGSSAIRKFFESTTAALDALMPVLKSVGNTIFGIIIPSLAKMGENIAPGLLIFFDKLGEGFKILGDVLTSPEVTTALNNFLVALGDAVLGTVKELGPVLPQIFRDLSDALVAVGPLLPAIAKALAEMLKNVTPLIPKMVELITPRLIDMLEEWTKFLVENGPLLLDIATKVMNLIKWVGSLSDTLERLTGSRFITILPLWSAAIDLVSGAMSKLKDFAVEVIANLVEWAGKLYGKFIEIKDKIVNFFKDLPGQLAEKGADAGRALVDALKNGILDNLGPLGWAANKMMEKISEYLPRSPAKKGPFSGAGYSKNRGRSLALDFAAGVTQGYGSAEAAGGGLSKATASGMEEFVNDMLELSGFGQRVLSLFGDIMNNVFDAIDIFTTNPFTGESLFDQKGWKRTVSDEDLRKQREDRAFREALNPSAGGVRGPAGAELATTPLDLKKTSDRSAVAAGIASEAQRRGYSAEETQAILSTAIQESGLNPTAWDPSGQWLGIFQQDSGYKGREDPNKQVTEFFNRLDKLRGSGGSSGDIWKDIFWLQQRPGETSANDAFANGRQNYLTEIQSQKNAAADLLKEVITAPPAQAGSFGTSLSGSSRGGYGLSAGTNINYGAEGFPPWVYALAETFGVQASTYGGHQEGSGANRGIDWNGDPKQLERLARYLSGSSSVEQLIYENPNTGRRIGKDPGDRGANQSIDDYYRDDWSGHRDHLHSRFNAPVGLPAGMYNWGGPGGLPASVGADKDRNKPNVAAGPAGQAAGQVPFPAQPGDDLQSPLDNIAGSTDSTVDQQDKILQELRGQDPLLEQAIRVGQDSNSTDAQVASSLDYISQASRNQPDTAQGRYAAGQLDTIAGDIPGERGFTQPGGNSLDSAAGIANGAVGVVGDVFKIIDGVLNSIGAASNISETLVRGVENSEDLFNMVDQVQAFVDLIATISQTVTDGLGLAASIASVAGADPTGGGSAAAGALSAAAAISGIVTSVISSINAAIDLGQEAYRIASKYVGKMLAYLVGAGQGSLMGDVHFLLDQATGELKTWSGDNPQDKRTHQIPSWLQEKDATLPGNKIRDLNMYVGPGTDPNQAMNAAMWSIRTDQSGVFASSGY